MERETLSGEPIIPSLHQDEITVCLRLAGAFAKFQTAPLHRRHSLDLSHALPADLFRRHPRSPKGHDLDREIRQFVVNLRWLAVKFEFRKRAFLPQVAVS